MAARDFLDASLSARAEHQAPEESVALLRVELDACRAEIARLRGLVPAEGRSWTLTHDGERPLTINALVNMHRMRWAEHTDAIRQTWGWLARQARIPKLQRARFDVTPLHANNRSPQDPAACAPEAKAAIDGLVDAGVLPDDNGRHVVAIEFNPPRVAGVDGLELTICEVL
jgi:hypothetical protein